MRDSLSYLFLTSASCVSHSFSCTFAGSCIVIWICHLLVSEVESYPTMTTVSGLRTKLSLFLMTFMSSANSHFMVLFSPTYLMHLCYQTAGNKFVRFTSMSYHLLPKLTIIFKVC
ncbi:hypothetical protein IW262DRAFT_1414908 [Armillaria fumosa]|nr:hypothetical protein IW262DRAFT_1414908 [Armillaria fumosa]